MILNAAWIVCVQFELLWLSVLTILALLAVLVVVFDILTNMKPSSRVEAIVVDATAFVYLGWVCVAVVANIAVARTTGDGSTSQPAAIAALTAAALAIVATAIARLPRARSGEPTVTNP